MIGAGDVVGDKVHQDLQPSLMGTLDEGVQLCLSRVWIFGEVGVDVVVVLDGIGRACLPLHRVGVVGTDALGAVVGLRGVLQQADIPDVGSPETADIGEGFGSEVTELPRAVLGECAMGLAGRILIPPESSEGGVDDDLLLHRCR